MSPQVTNSSSLCSRKIAEPSQILELSGIGNKEILEKVGVKVIVDLPGVGENVQEHVYSGTTFGMYFAR